jgi:predicted ester cyclase
MKQELDETFIRDFVARLHDAVNAHDADAVAGLCAEDIEWFDPAAPEPLRGREAVRRFHRDTMFRALPDVRIDLVGGPYLSLDRTSIATRLVIRGTMTGPLIPPGFAPTGGHVEFETAEFSDFRGSLLAHHRVVLDMLALARQIGAAPKSGTFAEHLGVWLQRGSHLRLRHSANARQPPTVTDHAELKTGLPVKGNP